MADPLLTQQQIEDELDGGADELRRLCGDDGAGQADAAKVARGIAIVSEDAYGILRAAGWNNAQIVELATNDPSVRFQLVMMFRHNRAQLKNEFKLADGKTVFSADDQRARDMLRAKASAALRTAAEEISTIGKSQLIRPRGSAERPPSRVFTGRGF